MIVQHPAFKSVTHDVDNPEDWVAQGWTQLDPPVVPDAADDTDETPQDDDSYDE